MVERILFGPGGATATLQEGILAAIEEPLTLQDDSVRQTLRRSTPCSTAVTGPVTGHVLVSIGPSQRIRLIRNAGHIDPAAAPGVYPLVTVKIGSTVIYLDKMEPGLPWSETVCFEGELGEDLTVDIDANTAVYFNARYEVFS